MSLLRTSQTIELTVRVDAGIRGPQAFYLRGMAYDVFDGRTWSRSASADAASVLDAGDDGWVDVAPPSPSRPRWRVRVEDVGGRGRTTALWTLPGAERLLFEDRTRETGVRLYYDIARELGNGFRAGLRVGYAARNQNVAGFTGGANVLVDF